MHGGKPKYYHRVIGGNFLWAPSRQCAAVKLKKLDEWTEARQRNADLYRSKLRTGWWSTRPGWTVALMTGRCGPAWFGDRRHIYNQFVAHGPAEMQAFLTDAASATGVLPVPFHQQDCFQYLGYKTDGSHQRIAHPEHRGADLPN